MKAVWIAGAGLACCFALSSNAEDRPSAAMGAGEAASAGASKGKPWSSDYRRRIIAAITPHLTFSELVPAEKPVAEVTLTVAPDGTILAASLTKPSTFAPWNEAVLRAVERTKKLPPDVDGRVPSRIQLTFTP